VIGGARQRQLWMRSDNGFASVAAIKELLDPGHGKAPQVIEVSGPAMEQHDVAHYAAELDEEQPEDDSGTGRIFGCGTRKG
jgi:hypothetical protein